MSARILDLCDAIVAQIEGLWSPVAPDGVSRTYGIDISLNPEYPDILLQGRQVYVFPVEWRAPDMLDRLSLMHQYTASVVTIERYTDATGFPTAPWMDARIAFVQDTIYNPIRAQNNVLSSTLVPVPDNPGEVSVVYDLGLFMKNKTFFSVCTFNFQEAY